MYSTGLSEWSEPVEWQYEPCDHWGPVDFVELVDVNQGNHIHWEFEHGYNPYDPNGPGPGPQPGGDTEFSDNFEGGLGNWTSIDADGDGQNWYHSSQSMTYSCYDYTGWGHNTSDGFAISQSYTDCDYSVYNADNFLVTNQMYAITASSTLTFWADYGNDSYPDHFGLYVATANNPTPADFTMVWEGTAKAGKGAKATTRHNDNRYQNWRQHTVNLGAYAGQNVYIAFRHTDTDQYELYIDDVTLTAGAKGGSAEISETGMLTENLYALNITDIANFDERIYTLYNLMNDARFDVMPAEANGMFLISEGKELDGEDLQATVEEFLHKTAHNFAAIDKFEVSEMANAYKAAMPSSIINSLMMDIYAASRENNLCATGDPFCTDNGMYEFPAGVDAGSGETGPDYNCLYTTPNPAWYYMRIGEPGDMDIYMYSTPSVDIDFCCWGPFEDPITPCPNGLTSNKVVSCSYSTSATEHCMIPATAQTGEYYILVITNYSNQQCNINFSKIAGSGTTDCGIMPAVDIIGFLVTRDGEYLDIVGATVRDYTDTDEYGEHVYCVRPIYPGLAELPSNNFYFSMGCPVCTNEACAAPSHLEGTYEWRNGQYGALLRWVVDSRDIVAYNIYRSTNGVDYEKVGAIDGNNTEYFDAVEVGTYYYQVTAISDCGESVPALTENGANFVIVTVTGIEEMGGVAMYPNPTSGNVKIVANAMNHITVINGLGQVVYDMDVDADEMSINMAQFNAGIYTVRIATENGVSVQRLTVVR